MYVHLFVFCKTVSSFRAGRVTTIQSSRAPGTQQMLIELDGNDKKHFNEINIRLFLVYILSSQPDVNLIRAEIMLSISFIFSWWSVQGFIC